jgi:hypothetical protein
MENCYNFKKSYANDTALCNEFFKDKIAEMVGRRFASHSWHYWDPVTKDIAEHLNTKLELFRDFQECNISIHHVNLFICREGVVGGLHIDNASDPRHCSINIPLEGCELSEIFWVRPDQFQLGNFDVRNGVRAGYPQGIDMNDPTGWEVTDTASLAKTVLIKTDTWHTVDNRKNPKPRVCLAFRLLGNPSFVKIFNTLNEKGLLEIE